MFIDNFLLVSNAQALTGTAVATNVIDLGDTTVRRQIGTGEPIGFGLSVDEAADSTTGDETYQIAIETDEDPAFGSATVLATFVRTAAQLAVGAMEFLPIPQSSLRLLERYLTLRYTLGGTTPSVTVTAFLTTHSLFSLQARAYTKNYAV